MFSISSGKLKDALSLDSRIGGNPVRIRQILRPLWKICTLPGSIATWTTVPGCKAVSLGAQNVNASSPRRAWITFSEPT
jgi:hypothetical protein